LKKVFYGLGSGLRQNLDWGDFKYLACAIPPLSEQAAIVRFLDHADRRIRRYIRAKQKLVALLEEQKQAIIHRAVTGQIDVRTGRPYPAYKPSGVSWLGDVPEHWAVRAFTRSSVERADYRGATPTKTESGVFLVTAKNIRKGWVDYEKSREFVAQEEYGRIMRRGLPRRGDLLLTTEAPLGNAALIDREDVALAQRVIRFRLDPRTLLPQFGLHSVLDPYFQDQLLCRGTGSTALGIKASKLPQLRIVCPLMDEQEAILAHIAERCRPVDADRALTCRQIELVREYRTRLIADVVTGKLDVREAAAGLPDETEEPEPFSDTEAFEAQDDPHVDGLDPDLDLQEADA
jgi:type I restriction enzyme S subunit